MPADLASYYQDHWVEIEPERMTRYESMFVWREGHEALIAPAGVDAGHTVVDYGCGPGALAVELARRVGPQGKVIGLDVNPEFLAKADALAAAQGVEGHVETRLMTDAQLPLPEHTADRVLCKNVLEYVPDPQQTINEFHRVLRTGGVAHVSDSDWGAVIFGPSPERFDKIMAAAGIAFRTPLIGRRLYGLFRTAGFSDIKVQVLASPDTTGALRPVLTNMASYARLSGQLVDAEIDAFLDDIERTLDDQSYFALLPQFLVTGTKG